MVEKRLGVKRRPQVLFRGAPRAENFERLGAHFKDVARGDVREAPVDRLPVNPDGGERGLDGVELLCEEGADHAGQDVAGAGRGEHGVPGGVHPGAAAAERRHRAGALQDDDRARLDGKLPGGGDAVDRDAFDGAAQKPRGFAFVRRDHRGGAAREKEVLKRHVRGDEVERVGVDDEGLFRL